MAAKTPAKNTTAPKQRSTDELRAELITNKNDMLSYQRSLAAGELKNTRIIGTTRREIARLMTALKAAEQTGEGEK